MMYLTYWFIIGGILMILGVIGGLWFHWSRRPSRRASYPESQERQEPTLEADLFQTEDAHSLRNQVGHLGDLTPEHPLADKILMDIEIRPVTPDSPTPSKPGHTTTKRIFSIPTAFKREKNAPSHASDSTSPSAVETAIDASDDSMPPSDHKDARQMMGEQVVKSFEDQPVNEQSVEVAVPPPTRPYSIPPMSQANDSARSASVVSTPPTAKMTLMLTVLAPHNQPFIGSNILKVAYELQLKLHRSGVLDCFMPDIKKPICSIAHLREPGTFHATNIQQMAIPGLLVFTHLPAAIDAVAALNFTLATAQELAKRLGGTLCDDQHNRINTRKIVQLRNKVADFERNLHRLSP